MESSQQRRHRKKHRSSSRSSSSKNATFYRFASCTPLKLDDVKTRGKKMAKTATRTHHQTSSLLVGSYLSKSQSLKTSDQVSGQDPVIQPARGSAASPAKLPKKVNYQSPNAKELTKELGTRPKKPKVQLSNANHPVRRGEPKTYDGIFQRGRQRPSGPVRTFIVFKASSKNNQMRRRKRKRSRIPKLPSEGRFSAVPVYNPRFYNKSELKGTKLANLGLSNKINVVPAKTNVDGVPAMWVQSGVAEMATETAAASATSFHFTVPANVAAERRGTKKAAPRSLSTGPTSESKLTSSSLATEHGKSAAGLAFEEKAHIGSANQSKKKSKKKRLSVTILQKKPIRRRSRIYKPAKGNVGKRPIKSKLMGAKKPAGLVLSRKCLLAIIQPGYATTLTERMANIKKLKKLEKEEE